MNRTLFTGGLVFLLSSGFALGKMIEIFNVQDTRTKLGVSRLFPNTGIPKVKICILDNGFEGSDSTDPEYLPGEPYFTKIEYYPESFIAKYPDLGKPTTKIAFSEEPHGRRMAQVVWNMCQSGGVGPKIFGVNANGITNFKRAIRYCLAKDNPDTEEIEGLDADIFLYARNFESVGNFDGKGPINAYVTEVVNAGKIWIATAGNYANQVFNANTLVRPQDEKIEVVNTLPEDLRMEENMLRLRKDDYGVRLQVFQDNAPIAITLAWNSSANDFNTGTDNDLDLFIYDENKKPLLNLEDKPIASTLTQVKTREEEDDASEESIIYPREKLSLRLNANRKEDKKKGIKPGYYYLYVKRKGGRFRTSDYLRITVQPSDGGMGLYHFVDAKHEKEIMVPADHPGVITFGASSTVNETYSAVGPTMDGRYKPDVKIKDPGVAFSDGFENPTASYAAAYGAAVSVILKGYRPEQTTDEIKTFFRQLAILQQKADEKSKQQK